MHTCMDTHVHSYSYTYTSKHLYIQLRIHKCDKKQTEFSNNQNSNDWSIFLSPYILTNSSCCCFFGILVSAAANRLVGLVVRRPPRERKVPGSNPACAGIFSGSSHTSDSKIGTPVATLPGAWHYRVSTGTGRPGVSIL